MKKKMKTLKKGHQVNQAVSLDSKKSPSKTPGVDRGVMSKMPQGPSVGMSARGPMVHKARANRLKGVKI